MRIAPRLLMLAAVAAGGLGAGGALALGQAGAGAGSSGTGTAGPGATVTGTIVTGTSAIPPPAGPPKGTAAEQTHPAVLPRTGGPRTRFALRLRLADAPGHSGALASGYRLALRPPAKRAASRCAPAAPANIDSGIAHQVVRVALLTPPGGWCTGRYTLTVFLQRGPYCPKPAPGQPPTPCPLFAEQDINVGSTHFTVAARR